MVTCMVCNAPPTCTINVSTELGLRFDQAAYTVSESVDGGELMIDLDLVSLSTNSPSPTAADIWVTLEVTPGLAGEAKLFRNLHGVTVQA